MAQSQQQYPPREFSPPQTTSSSHHSPFPGSNKRQRLSPNAQSPYNSPNMANIALPNQVFSSPYYGAQPNGSLSNSSQNATASIAQSGTMGPPSRPMDKPTDMNELSDVLLGSGVDLKEEEAALLGRHNFSSQQHQQQQQADTSFSSNLINSLNNDGSNHSTANTFMANNGFNVLAQNLPGDRSSFYGGGTFNQPATPFESAADRAEFERKKALRRKAERLQYHLNDPFLLTGWLQRRISQQAQKMQVIIPNAGLLSSTNYSGQVTEIAVAGPDNHEVLTLLKGQDLLYHDSPLVDLLTLVSLAAEERLRTLVEDAATLAKGRRLGSHGVVPDSLADLAVGDGAPESAHTLPTPSNSAISPKSNPLKRSYAAMNRPPTPVSNGLNTPTSAVSFPNTTVQALRQITINERRLEEERIMKRARRAAVASEKGRAGSVPTGPGITPPGLLGERAPDVETKRGSKKEQKRQADAKATEAQQHAATNKTMNMALGLGGSLGKKLSWMTKDTSGGGGSSLLPRVNTNTQSSSKSSTANGISGGAHLPPGRKYGEFREDRESGAGIQLRDMISVLATESKEKKALAKAYTRLR